ncbi:MAG: hypothetical protein DLM69_05535 [Candidatus Chloroheliales bacterium]|nr:MAG: hypothetical protein DLM69_05535 [Chloroflexota bacterium]
MQIKRYRQFKIVLSLAVLALLLGMTGFSHTLAQTRPNIKVISPSDGATITSTDIPVTVQVSNFTISAQDVGLPDKAGEGHIHVMLDNASMGVLFNFYTSASFTLPGEGVKPGPHTLIFDLASNTHVDMMDTAVQVRIDYQPTNPKPALSPASVAGKPEVAINSPAKEATVGPKFTIEVQPTNFTPSLDLEGKPNITGYGHYHVIVSSKGASMGGSMNMGGGMAMTATETMSSGMAMTTTETMAGGNMSGGMSMGGMIGMPGSNTIPVDLSAWPSGKYNLIVEPVSNDHTPIDGSKPGQVSIMLNNPAMPAMANDSGMTAPTPSEVMSGSSTSGSGSMAGSSASSSGTSNTMPTTGNADSSLPLSIAIIAIVLLVGGFMLQGRLVNRRR